MVPPYSHLCHTASSVCTFELFLRNFIFAAGADYIELDASLVFDKGLDTTQCVYIPVLNDECLEYVNESFYIYLSSDQDCVQFSNDSYEAYIIDDDCECYIIRNLTYMYTLTALCYILRCFFFIFLILQMLL